MMNGTKKSDSSIVVCTENLNPSVAAMKSAQEGV
jgi:hypothetical protein